MPVSNPPVTAISASDATYQGTVRITGGANITVGTDASGLSIVGGAGGAGGGVMVAASNTTYTSGTVSITGVGGGVTVSSNTGQRVDISVAAPVAQTAQTGISSIAASDATYTSGQVQFTGSNAVTVKSAAGQKVVIDAPVQTVATAISGISASDTLYTSGTVKLTGVGGGVTVSSNTGQRVDISVAAPVAQTAQTGISGISASDTLYTSGTVKLTGVGGGITVSSNTGQRVDLSVAAPVAQTGTQFSAGLSNIGNTLGDTVTVAGRLILAGGNNITLSGSSNGVSETITISGAAAGGAQTAISGVAASNTTYTSGSVTFTGVGGGITVSSNTGQRVDLSVAAPVAQTVQTQHVHDVTLSTTAGGGTAGLMALISSGTMRLLAGNNITLSQNATNDVVISGQNTVAATQFSGGLSNIGNTVGDTVTVSNRLILAGGNNITLSGSSNGSSLTITISGPAAAGAQTGISSIAASNTTYTSGQVEFTGSNAATVKSSANQRVVIDVPTQTAQTQSNIQGIAGSNTTYNTGTVEFTGSNMVTVKSSANQRVVIDATQSVQTQNLFDLTLSGNSTSGGAGYALVSSGTLSLAGGPNITLSQDGNKVSISGGAGGAGGGIALSNTQTMYTSGTVKVSEGGGAITIGSDTGQVFSISVPQTSSLSASTNIVISTTGSTIKFSVPILEPNIAVWQNFPLDLAATVVNLTGNNKFPMFWGEVLPGNVTLNSVGFHLSNFSTGTLQSFTVQFGVYTYVNSTSAALLGSASDQFILSTASSASWSGQRDFVLTSPSTQTAISNLSGGGYLFGANFSVAATGSMAMNLYGAGATTIAPLGRLVPGSNNASTGATQGLRGIFGQHSASSAAMPANVRVADMFANQGTGAAWYPWIYIAS